MLAGTPVAPPRERRFRHLVTFVDSVSVDTTAGTAEGALFVDAEADYLADHFPSAPMLPGLVMLETAVRTAAALWRAHAADPQSLVAVLERIERLHVLRRVVPGETLVVRVQMAGEREANDRLRVRAEGGVREQVAGRSRFQLRRVDVAGGNHGWNGGGADDSRGDR